MAAKRWLTEGVWAVLDQGLFATSNFALNVLLARWLVPDEYGVFGVGFATFLFVAVLYQATLLEPMLVFGSGKHKDHLPEYLGALVYGHVGFAAVGALALLLAGIGLALAGLKALSVIMFALALTEPFILLLWLMRRACYVRGGPRLAASGGGWYMALMLAGAYVLYRTGWLSAVSALGVMAISSLAVSLFLAVRLGVKVPSLREGGLVRDLIGDHWRYGRWSVINQGLHWIPTNSYYILLPLWAGLAAGASFKAMMNLTMPVLQGVWALSILLLPALVRARDEGHGELDSQVRRAVLPFVAGTTLYWVLLGLLHQPLVSLLYGGRYVEQADLLWIFGLAPVFIAVKLVVGHALRALERPDWLLWAYLVSAVVALALAAVLMPVWGVAGAATGLAVSQAITAVLVLIAYQRLRLRTEAPAGHDATTAELAEEATHNRRAL